MAVRISSGSLSIAALIVSIISDLITASRVFPFPATGVHFQGLLHPVYLPDNLRFFLIVIPVVFCRINSNTIQQYKKQVAPEITQCPVGLDKRIPGPHPEPHWDL